MNDGIPIAGTEFVSLEKFHMFVCLLELDLDLGGFLGVPGQELGLGRLPGKGAWN